MKSQATHQTRHPKGSTRGGQFSRSPRPAEHSIGPSLKIEPPTDGRVSFFGDNFMVTASRENLIWKPVNDSILGSSIGRKFGNYEEAQQEYSSIVSHVVAKMLNEGDIDTAQAEYACVILDRLASGGAPFAGNGWDRRDVLTSLQALTGLAEFVAYCPNIYKDTVDKLQNHPRVRDVEDSPTHPGSLIQKEGSVSYLPGMNEWRLYAGTFANLLRQIHYGNPDSKEMDPKGALVFECYRKMQRVEMEKGWSTWGPGVRGMDHCPIAVSTLLISAWQSVDADKDVFMAWKESEGPHSSGMEGLVGVITRRATLAEACSAAQILQAYRDDARTRGDMLKFKKEMTEACKRRDVEPSDIVAIIRAPNKAF